MAGPEGSSELELRDYLRILSRRRGVVAGATLVVVAAALILSFLQTPVYAGTAELLLQPRSTESLFDQQAGQRDPIRAVQTEIQVLKSQPVREAVRREIGVAPKVRVSPVGQTDVIQVETRSTDPRQASIAANAYAEAYIDFRRAQAVDDLLAAGHEIQSKIAELQRQIDEAEARAPEVPRGTTVVSPERDVLLQQQALFKQKLDQLQVDAALKTGGAQLVTEASVPSSPVEPTPERTGVLALAVGLLFGVGLAFLFEYLDDSIKTKEDVERATGAVPTLGLVPAVDGWKDREKPLVVSVSDPKAPAAEAYRSLRTSIQFMGLDRPLRTVQVTSPGAGEGKSTTIANLGVALAQAGQRVVLVCCDLRRPRIHEFFGLDNTEGFTSVLLGDVPLSAAVQAVPGVERLTLLASGPVPPNPSELLSGRRTVEVLTTLQAEADLVLVDCPPVLPVTDSAVLSSRVDATLIVATAGKTTRKELQRAYEVLSQVGAPIIGTVLNGVPGADSYGYAYRDTYSRDDDKKSRRQPVAKL